MNTRRPGRASPAHLSLLSLALPLALGMLLARAQVTAPAKVPTGATPDTGIPVPSRLLRELPEGTARQHSQTTAAAVAAGSPDQPTPADPATVAHELGADSQAVEPLPSAAPADAVPLDAASEGLEFGRKRTVRGMLSVGVGSHDTYHVGVGISTELTPSTTLSAGVVSGRWDGGWGWRHGEIFPPYRTFPELRP